MVCSIFFSGVYEHNSASFTRAKRKLLINPISSTRGCQIMYLVCHTVSFLNWLYDTLHHNKLSIFNAGGCCGIIIRSYPVFVWGGRKSCPAIDWLASLPGCVHTEGPVLLWQTPDSILKRIKFRWMDGCTRRLEKEGQKSSPAMYSCILINSKDEGLWCGLVTAVSNSDYALSARTAAMINLVFQSLPALTHAFPPDLSSLPFLWQTHVTTPGWTVVNFQVLNAILWVFPTSTKKESQIFLESWFTMIRQKSPEFPSIF